MLSLDDGSPEAATVLPLARRILETHPGLVDDAELVAALREHAYWRATSSCAPGKRSTYYLDKYRFETVPELLEALGARARRAVAELEPDARGSPARSSARSRSPRPRRSPLACRS
jgi:hypothetical protein